jgi:FtsP/CotA-like multicopper oxidase with cupredoxin domain
VTELRVDEQLRVRNQLPLIHPQFGHAFGTSTHLHGSASLPQYDGYADDVTMPGDYKDYWYPNFQDARTLWYHDHFVHHTAENAYGGLAAQYHLHDRVQERNVPKGAYDVPLTITDAIFASDGKLAYDDNEFSGLWGDVILVNGRPWPTMKVQRRIYRFRVLNASIARSYRFHLGDNGPITVIGTDGGLMPAPVTVSQWRHGGAERYEILIDFSRYAPGTTVDLRNRSNGNNIDYDHTDKVMRFQVTDEEVNTADRTWNTIPTALVDSEIMRIPVTQSVRMRRFELDHDDDTNIFKISNRTWEDVQRSGHRDVMAAVGVNDVEIWEIENNSGGWFHPVHIHLVDFRILSRNGRAPFAYENGPKDVVYIGEDETVRLLIKFAPTPGSAGGRYMVHCHNLPHEDHDMMHQFSVGDSLANDPISSAPARRDDGQYDDGRKLE